MNPGAKKSKKFWVAALLAVVVILFVLGHFLPGAVGKAVLSIAIIMLIVAGPVALILMLVASPLKNMPAELAKLRQTYPVAYAFHFEVNGYGAIVKDAGGLVLWRLRRGALEAYGTLKAGTYTITPARMQFAGARKVDGIEIASNASDNDYSIRIALSHDTMTLTGNLLTGQALDEAIEKLR